MKLNVVVHLEAIWCSEMDSLVEEQKMFAWVLLHLFPTRESPQKDSLDKANRANLLREANATHSGAAFLVNAILRVRSFQPILRQLLLLLPFLLSLLKVS